MKKQMSLLSLSTALVLSACVAPVVPLTPDTLAGCWQGEVPLVGATAKVQISATDVAKTFNVNGSAKFGGNEYPFNDVKIDFDATTGELRPSNLPGQVQNVPIKLKVEGGEIKATATGTPFSLSLKRCAN